MSQVWWVFEYDKALKNVFVKSEKTQEMAHSSLPVRQKNLTKKFIMTAVALSNFMRIRASAFQNGRVFGGAIEPLGHVQAQKQ